MEALAGGSRASFHNLDAPQELPISVRPRNRLSSGTMSAVLGRVQVYSDLPPGIRESDVFSRLEEVDEEVTWVSPNILLSSCGGGGQLGDPDLGAQSRGDWLWSSRRASGQTVRCQVLHLCPGFHKTLKFIGQRLWWPTMAGETRCFVFACVTWTLSKLFDQTLAGLLQPLETPSRLWSHVVVDWPSESNSTLLTIVDRFSRAVHFVQSPKPKTAKLPVYHVILSVFEGISESDFR